MFRFASLYAMGQLLERTPVYFLDKKIIQLIEKELKEVFPNFYSRIYYLVVKIYKIKGKIRITGEIIVYWGN